jgi:hypothetical protein
VGFAEEMKESLYTAVMVYGFTKLNKYWADLFRSPWSFFKMNETSPS